MEFVYYVCYEFREHFLTFMIFPVFVGPFLGGGGGMSEDGWNTVGMSGRPRYTVDTTKLKAAKDEPELRLGNAGQFREWSGGANVKGKNTNKRPVTAGSGPSYSSNIYTALVDTSSEDGKRLPPSLSRYRPVVDPIKFCLMKSSFISSTHFNHFWLSLKLALAGVEIKFRSIVIFSLPLCSK
jgi:hypothetical protein